MIEAANDSGAAQVTVPNDRSVIEALRRGDEGVFARLVDRFRILINRAKTRAAREGRTVPIARFDVEVEAAEAAVAPARVQPAAHPTKPGHWAHPPPDLGASPERRLLAREARQHLQNAIEALPEHQRLVLILRDVEGCSTDEVCSALGFQATNTRVLLHRARAKVRSALEPYLAGV